MKIGLLICDHVRPDLQGEYGDYPSMFKSFLSQGIKNIEFNNYFVVDGHFPENVDCCDAYICSGSRCSVNDKTDWLIALQAFICRLYEAQKKLIGICFGHQMIAKALGGFVQPSHKGWGVGVMPVKVVQQESWMKPALNEVSLVVHHQEQVVKMPQGAKVLMTSDFCPCSMMLVGQSFLGLQGHPEFSRDYSKALITKMKNTFPRKLTDNGLDSLTLDVDSRQILSWISHFLREQS